MKFSKLTTLSNKSKTYFVSLFLICGLLLNSFSGFTHPKILTFFLNPNATITASSLAICKNETAIITFTGLEGTEPYTFTYQLNTDAPIEVTTTSGNSLDISLAGITVGDFTYKLTNVENSEGNNQTITDQEITVKVNPLPIVNFTFNNNASCSGEAVNFTNTSTGLGNLTYNWDFGDGKTSALQNPTNTFEALGCGSKFFNVKLTVTDENGCSASNIETISVAEKPDIQFRDKDTRDSVFSNCNNASPSNPNYEVTVENISNSTCIDSFSVDWGDGSSSSSVFFPATHTYNSIGVFDMKIRASGDNNCVNEVLYIVKNLGNPAAGFSSPGNTTNLCIAEAELNFGITNYQSNSNDTSYTLDFGDGSPLETYSQSEMTDPLINDDDLFSHKYEKGSCLEENGQFIATLSVQNACGTTQLTADNITILEPSVAKFESTEFACINDKIVFIDKSIVGNESNCVKNADVSWDFGDGTIIKIFSVTEASNIEHQYTNPGIYTVELSVLSKCNPSSFTKEICIEPEIKTDFSVDIIEGCIPLNVNATNTTDQSEICSAPIYIWTVDYSSDNCGSIADWDYTNGTDSTSENPQFIFNSPGKYTLNQKVTSVCGTKTVTKIIDVKKPPTASIQAIEDVCGTLTINPEATLENCSLNTAPLIYNWTFTGGSVASSNTLNPGNIEYTVPGIYEITLEVTNDCGISSIAKETFELFEIPNITNTNLTEEICDGQSTSEITLNSNNSETTYTWSATVTGNISGFITNGISNTIPAHIIRNTGNNPETVTYTTTPSLDACVGTPVNFIITVNPSPIINTQPVSSEICLDGTPTLLEVTYTNGAGAATYQWFSNTTDAATGGSAITGETGSIYTAPGDTLGTVYYYVEISFNTTGGCSQITSNTASVVVNEIPVINDDEITIYSKTSFNFDPSTIGVNIVPVGTKYTWSNPTFSPTGSIIGSSAETTPKDQISQTLENTGTTPIEVTYIITPVTTKCTGNEFTIVVTVNPSINSNALITNNTCFKSNDGLISTNINGGIPFETGNPYLISWIGPNGFTSTDTTIVNIEAGLYILEVEDKEGYSIREELTVTEPAILSISKDVNKNTSCFGGNDGAIAVIVSGGTLPYTYNWSTTNGSGIIQNTQNQNALTPGSYTLEVTDKNNCISVSNYILTEPAVLKIDTIFKQDILCFSEGTGSIQVNISGGTPSEISPGNFDYFYNWTGPNGYTSSFKNINNLFSGNYTLTITDSLNCVESKTIVLNQFSEILIDYTKTDVTCYGKTDGTIEVTVSGGNPPYQISWNNLANGFSLSDLSANTYIATITDGNNCTQQQSIEITQPIFFSTPIITPISCNNENDGSIDLNLTDGIAPISVSWSDDLTAGSKRNNISPGSYTVTILDSDADQCPIIQTFIFTNPPLIAVSSQVDDALDCDIVNSGSIDITVSGGTAPYTFTWSNGEITEDLINISPGDYSVEIKDENNCIVTKQFSISRQEPLDIELIATTIPNCDLKTVSQMTVAKVTGGFLPYTYSWSAGSVSTTDNTKMVSSQNGAYTLTITDNKGCTKRKIFLVDLPSIGNADYSYTSFSIDNYNLLSIEDPIQFTNLTTGNYSNITWDFGDGSPTSSEENPIHSYNQVGVFNVVLKIELDFGCIEVIEKTLNITKGYVLITPNAFSPNNDGYNETIRPSFRGFEEIEMTIYDTWGVLIYYEKNLNLNGWDGKIKGLPAENGNYVMLVKGRTFYKKEINIVTAITLLI